MLRLGSRRCTVFLSHTWCGPDEPHERVIRIAKGLRRLGWRVWLDDTDMVGNIDGCIARGIQNSSVVVLFLTRDYCRKINRAANSVTRNDNCYNEFSYALWAGKPIVPVMMDATMRNPSQWSPGVIPMRLSCELYVDGCCNLPEVARRIDERLKKMNFRRPMPPIRPMPPMPQIRPMPPTTSWRTQLFRRPPRTTVWL